MAVRPRSLTSAEIRASAQPGSILLMRDNAVVYDGGDTRVTKADYGVGFKAALAAAQAGDKLVCGPGEFELVEADVDVDDFEIICNSTVLRTNDDYNWVLRVNGDRVTVRGMKVSGGEDANTPPVGSNAWGFNIRGDDCKLYDCSDFGITAPGLFGGGLFAWEAFRFEAYRYVSEKASYASFVITDSIDSKLHDFTSINPKNRCGVIRTLTPPGSALDKDAGRNMVDWKSVILDGLFAYMSESPIGGAAAPGINFDMFRDGIGQRLDEVLLRRCHFKAEDIFNDTSSANIMKVQGCDRFILDDVFMDHYANAGTGEIRSLVVESVAQSPIKELICRNVRASGHVVGNNTPFDRASFEDSHFGLRQCEGGITIRDLAPKVFTAKNSTFNVHSGAYAIDVPDPVPADMSWSFSDCEFRADDTNPVYVFLAAPLAAAGAGHLRFDSSNRRNNVSGIFSPSASRVATLLATTDRDGNLLWDETIAASSGTYNLQPEPGAGPNFFPDVPVGPEGTRIYNIRYKTTGSSFPRYWISNGTNWVAV